DRAAADEGAGSGALLRNLRVGDERVGVRAVAGAAPDLDALRFQAEDAAERSEREQRPGMEIEGPDVLIAPVRRVALDPARDVEARPVVGRRVIDQRGEDLPRRVAPGEPAGAVRSDELRVAVPVDEIAGQRDRHRSREMVSRAEEPERPGGEEDPIDDVAEADVAEVGPFL